jgi:hypothetical protein
MSNLLFKLVCGCVIRLTHPDPHLTETLGYLKDDPLYQRIEFVSSQGEVVRTLTGSGDQGFTASPELGFGPSPDQKYFSFLTVTQGGGGASEEIRVSGGAHCDFEDFVVVDTLAPIKPSKFEGWSPTAPHAILQNLNARERTIALPREEAAKQGR